MIEGKLIRRGFPAGSEKIRHFNRNRCNQQERGCGGPPYVRYFAARNKPEGMTGASNGQCRKKTIDF